MELIKANFNAIPETAFKKSDDHEFDDVKVILNVIYKEIPQKSSSITISLPHYDLKRSICILIKDLDRNSEQSIKKFQKTLQDASIDVSNIRVLPLKELTLMQFAEKRKLAASYSLFLVDKRIGHRGMAKLGKFILRRSNHPIFVDFNNGVSKAIKFGTSHIKMALKANGPQESVEIANLEMTKEEIEKNFLATVESIIEKWPGKLENIRSIYFKATGPTYPVYHTID